MPESDEHGCMALMVIALIALTVVLSLIAWAVWIWGVPWWNELTPW